MCVDILVPLKLKKKTITAIIEAMLDRSDAEHAAARRAVLLGNQIHAQRLRELADQHSSQAQEVREALYKDE